MHKNILKKKVGFTTLQGTVIKIVIFMWHHLNNPE